MDFTMVIPVLIAFVLSVAAGPVVIPVLRRLKMDQTEREDGVKSHLKKAGTPTMGGVMILFAIAVTSLIYVREYPKVIPVLFVTIGFGLVGFLDDYLKVVLHRSDGLMPMQKMALQIVITAIFAFYIVKVAKIPLTMLIPFSGGKYLNIGWFAIPVLCSDRYRQWCEFYRWTGRACIQCNSSCGNLLYSCCDRNKEWDRTDYLCSGRCVAGILIIQRLSGKRIYGRHRITGSWGICCFDSIHAPDAIIHYHRRIDLSGRSFISYDPGNIF